ncbi:DUF72 domain-containing protein [Catenovulum adriaticum]|uniref:DUF72 domain-containing protein n=1 Tax=Catenovulum adriaticum TaxID=2984846 RepID=A0ABY7AKY6_9ALTE|nr:DUF72 domain-containing protein [Catenovulum sp. TS8]WAJ70134.1 DUF72 domain-containing protein [Catenovulum sp. TS8]
MSAHKAQIQLGCPQWSHPDWQHNFFSDKRAAKQHLAEYAQYYTSVEGNTTFYALPSVQTVSQWSAQVNQHFKFCFKLPQLITHKQGLAASQTQIEDFFALFSPMLDKQQIAAFQVQLPPYFSANRLAELADFLSQYSHKVPLAVEVRHPDFFNKGDSEKALNQLLIQYNVDRVMMDTRPVHSELPHSKAIIDAQNKKPKVPVHLLSTGEQPIVRYVGQTNLMANQPFIQPWLKHFESWLNQGKRPYLFIHTADNAQVHELSRLWLKLLTEQLGYTPYRNQDWPIELAKQHSKQTNLF